jgi:Flp pilus assembly pilin Flp
MARRLGVFSREAFRTGANRRAKVMVHLTRALNSLRFDEEGQTLVEYAFILVLVSIAVVSVLAAIGAFSPGVFSQINADF